MHVLHSAVLWLVAGTAGGWWLVAGGWCWFGVREKYCWLDAANIVELQGCRLSRTNCE